MVNPFSAFIKANAITGTIEQVDHNPYLPDSVPWDATHWKLHLVNGSKSVDLYYSSDGAFKNTSPNVEDCLVYILDLNSSLSLYDTYEKWAQHMGYDENSRIFEKRYNRLQTQVAGLRKFLGEDRFSELVEIGGN